MSTHFMYLNIINRDKLQIILTKVTMLFDIHPQKSCYKIISQIKLLSWLIIVCRYVYKEKLKLPTVKLTKL